jgi:phosphohistidine phosphatase
MALQLWLLRHGEAVPHDAKPDHERELTERGRDQARAAGRALAALDVEVHLCFTSPKVRARETAELSCAELGVEPVVHEPLAGGFDREDTLELLAAAEGDQRVLVVGHEPDFSQVVHDLTGARIDLKKGGVVGVRMDASRGELIVLLRPRELDRICG